MIRASAKNSITKSEENKHKFTHILSLYQEFLFITKSEAKKRIHSNSERSEQFLVTKCFSTCSWRFLRLDKLEQFKFKLEKNFWMEKHAGKVRKYLLLAYQIKLHFLKRLNQDKIKTKSA